MIPPSNRQTPFNLQPAFFVLNAAQNLTWVNTPFSIISGHIPLEIIGLPFSTLGNPMLFKNNFNSIKTNVTQSNPYRGKGHFILANGETALCYLDIRPVFDKKKQVKNYIAYGIDAQSLQNFALSEVEQSVIKNIENNFPKLTLEQVHVLWSKILNLIQNEGMYRTANLRLKDMAYALRTNTTYISEVINHFSSLNFNLLINQYRVIEAKKQLILPENQHLKIDAIGEKCGFGSRATFYRAFKSELNMTPKQFIALSIHNFTIC